jgi:hypothetical protein
MKNTLKKAPNYGKFRSRWVGNVLKYPAAAVGLHWVVQSMFYMDPTERWFKIGLDILMTVVFVAIISLALPFVPTLFISFLIAHTLNFLFNGQLWGVLKQYGLVTTPFDEFCAYVEKMAARAEREPSISSFITYGSLSRSEWSPYSDLDARILRRPGFMNGVQACWFLLQERSRALLARFPIDVYVIDHSSSLKKLR